MRRVCVLLVALAASACDRDSEVDPLVNMCRQQFECADHERCDETLGVCFRPGTTRGYPYVLQVLVEGDGRGLVRRTSTAPTVLYDSAELEPLVVQRTVRVNGTVRADADADAGADAGTVQAEIAFIPQNAPAYLREALSVFTRFAPTADGGREHQFAIDLDRATTYRARVIPLGTFASDLPPFWRPDLNPGVGTKVTFDYPPLEALSGSLAPETSSGREISPLQGLRVRLQNKQTGEVTSSVTTLGANGQYTVQLERQLLEELAQQELVLDLLRDGPAWSVTLAVDGGSLLPGGLVRIPEIPAPVRVQLVTKPIPATLTLTSTYDAPDGRPNPDRDWCRSGTSLTTRVRCAGRYVVPLGNATATVPLFPGFYEVAIVPGGNAQLANGYASRFDTLDVRVSPANQGPKELTLEASASYQGVVRGPARAPMPLVAVSAAPLGVRRNAPSETESVNDRSFQTVSARDGRYALRLESGGYDLTATPPEGTGFPQFCRANRYVPRSGYYDIEMTTPVVLRGRVEDGSGNAVFPARVEGFAIVEGRLGDRAIRIAATTTNDAGQFFLLMPPQIEDGDATPSMDAGVSLDGAVRSAARSDGGVPQPR